MIYIAVQITAIVLLVILLAVMVVYAAYGMPRQRIGYIPLPAHGVAAVVEALGITNEHAAITLYDLGCGDGRVLHAVLRRYPRAQGVGIEINPLVVMLARWRLRSLFQRVRVRRGDILRTNLKEATYLFAYLNHETMAALEPKLKQELATGSRLVSCDFPLPHKKPTRTITIGESWQLGQKLYIYDY